MQPEHRQTEEQIGVPAADEWPLFQAWAAAEGWRVPPRELTLYRQELADSAFVLRDGAGQPLGFVTIYRQLRSAWIGNLLVDPARRRSGYGRRLFRHALDTLVGSGIATLWLTASKQGLQLYTDNGFRPVADVERWVWQGDGRLPSASVVAGCGELYSLVRADAVAWGEPRAGLLALLARGGQILAAGSTVALLQCGSQLRVLGPWLSADSCPRSNRAILGLAMAASGSGEIAVDILGHSPVRQLLAAAGFSRTGASVLMMRGAAGKIRFNEMVALASLGSMG